VACEQSLAERSIQDWRQQPRPVVDTSHVTLLVDHDEAPFFPEPKAAALVPQLAAPHYNVVAQSVSSPAAEDAVQDAGRSSPSTSSDGPAAAPGVGDPMKDDANTVCASSSYKASSSDIEPIPVSAVHIGAFR
jgi:hypothetical protein